MDACCDTWKRLRKKKINKYIISMKAIEKISNKSNFNKIPHKNI